MFMTHHVRLQHAGCGGQRIHRRVDAQLRHRTGQHRCSVQMGKGGGRGRVRQVVCRDIDGLHRGDGTLVGGGNAFLQRTHIGGQRGLVAHGGGHVPQQGGDLRARLDKAENIVYEKQYVLPALIPEILRDGQGREGRSQSGAGRLVHLAEHKGGLVNDPGLVHLVPQVISLAAALTYAGKDGIAAVLIGHVPDQLHNEHRLAHARAAEQADFAALGIGGKQIHYLDAGLQHLLRGLYLRERGRVPVDGHILCRVNSPLAVDRFSRHIEHAAQGSLSHRHGYRSSRVHGRTAPVDTVCGGQGNAAHTISSAVLHHLGLYCPAA